MFSDHLVDIMIYMYFPEACTVTYTVMDKPLLHDHLETKVSDEMLSSMTRQYCDIS